MTRMTTISFGKANIDEFTWSAKGGSRNALAQSEPSQPVPGPEHARLDPVGKIGYGGNGFARGERQTAPEWPAPPLGRKGAQPDLVAIAGAHDGAHLADAVDQPAIQRHAPGQHVTAE